MGERLGVQKYMKTNLCLIISGLNSAWNANAVLCWIALEAAGVTWLAGKEQGEQ